MEGLHSGFMRFLFDIYYRKGSPLSQLQFSYAPEMHGFCHPSPTAAYQIGEDMYIAVDPF
jgi:hypothetical protein